MDFATQLWRILMKKQTIMTTIRSTALKAYLKPLLDKHQARQEIIFEDLQESKDAADQVLTKASSEHGGIIISLEAVKNEIETLHRSQVRAYMEQANADIKTFILKHLQEFMAKTAVPEKNDTTALQLYKRQCAQTILKLNKIRPNYKISLSHWQKLVDQVVSEQLSVNLPTREQTVQAEAATATLTQKDGEDMNKKNTTNETGDYEESALATETDTNDEGGYNLDDDDDESGQDVDKDHDDNDQEETTEMEEGEEDEDGAGGGRNNLSVVMEDEEEVEDGELQGEDVEEGEEVDDSEEVQEGETEEEKEIEEVSSPKPRGATKASTAATTRTPKLTSTVTPGKGRKGKLQKQQQQQSKKNIMIKPGNKKALPVRRKPHPLKAVLGGSGGVAKVGLRGSGSGGGRTKTGGGRRRQGGGGGGAVGK